MSDRNRGQELRVENPLFSTQEAAEYCGCKPAFLEKDRWSGKLGIKYIKLGGKVLYRMSDLDEFLNSATRTNTTA